MKSSDDASKKDHQPKQGVCRFSEPIDGAPTQRSYRIPEWFQKLSSEYVVKRKRVFVLYSNIFDYVILENKPSSDNPQKYNFKRTFRDFIHDDLVTCQSPGPFRASLSYSLTGELGTFTLKEIQFWQQVLGKKVILRREGELKAGEIQVHAEKQPTFGFDLLENLMRMRFHDETDPRTVAVFVDYFQHLVPNDGNANNVEIIRRIASDPTVEDMGNLLIAFTDDKNLLFPDLCNEKGVVFIEIPTPSSETKKKFFDFLINLRPEGFSDSCNIYETSDIWECEIPYLTHIDFESFKTEQNPEPDENYCVDIISRRTAGFSLKEIDDLNREVINSDYRKWRKASEEGKEPCKIEGIKLDHITAKRKEILGKKSFDLLKEVTPRGGFETVGGLENIKAFFKEIADEMKVFNTERVPKAVLLVGPPGTGKSIIAEAFAKESKVPMVELGTIRSMWVGETENRFERAIQLLREMAPVVVFVDEFDQMISQRSAVSGSGAHDTDKRMFGRILQIMGSNDYRGKIIWMAATNRPDLFDVAQLRRFDRIFPVLPPYSDDSRIKIFEAMRNGVITGIEYADDVKDALSDLSKKTLTYTGSEIEQVLRLAMSSKAINENGKCIVTASDISNAIDNFILNRDEEIYKYFTLLSISICNHIPDLPGSSDPDVPDDIRQLIEQIRKTKNTKALRDTISNMKRTLRMDKE